MSKRNFILLGLLVIVIVFLLMSRTCENMEKRIKLFSINESEIAKIEIKDPNNEITLAMIDNVWMIEEPLQTQARESQITRFFETFLALTTSSNPISQSIDRQGFFQVDSTGVEVTMYDRNDRQLSKVFVGRSNNNPTIAYIRSSRNNNIFQIENVQHVINPTLNSWRENRILNITENDISRITFNRNNEPYILFQDSFGWNLNLNELSAPLGYENADLNRLLQAMVNLQTSTYFDNVYEEYVEKLATPELEIYLELHTGSNIHLKIAKNDDNSYVLQRNDEYITLYRLTNSQFNQLNIEPENLVPAGDNLVEPEEFV